MSILSYPIFAKNGETVDLRKIYTSTNFSFDNEFESLSWLSLNNDHQLSIAADAVDSETPVLIKLNLGRSFYLVVSPNHPPTVRADATEISMLSNSSYNLFRIVENADRIDFKSNETQPAGASLNDGIFTITTTGGTAHFTASNENGTTDFSVRIKVVQSSVDIQGFSRRDSRIEIADVDVTEDFLSYPSIQESLDAVTLNEYKLDTIRIILKNTDGKYSIEGVDNFWRLNNLNPGGYQAPISVFKEYYVNGNWISHLQFSGLILRATENYNGASVSLRCVDISSILRKKTISELGPEKWSILSSENALSDRIYDYDVDETLSPIQPASLSCWSDRTELELQQDTLPTEGPPPAENIGRATERGIQTIGRLDDTPIAKFNVFSKTASIEDIANQIALIAGVYQVNLDMNPIELETPYISNHGSFAFQTERSRITRLPVDWAYDETQNRLFVLLSNPDERINDRIVQYDREEKISRVVYEFDADIRAYRITRLNSTTYYILATSYSDSNRASIYQYNSVAHTLTERVSPTDTYPPLATVAYKNHFEATKYLGDKGTFKCIGNNLYFKYRNSDEIGVARLQANGSPVSLLSDTEARNGAFDIKENEEIVLASVRGGSFSDITLVSSSYSGTFSAHRRIVTSRSFNPSRQISVTLTTSFNENVIVNFYLNRNIRYAGGADLRLERHEATSGTVTGSLGTRGSISSIDISVFGTGVGTYSITITAEAPPSFYTSHIQKRLPNGTVQTLLSETRATTTDPYSFQELLIHNDSLYVLSQRLGSGSSGLGGIDTNHSLQRYNLSADNFAASRENLLFHSDTADGAVHLFLHDDDVHFMYNLALYGIGLVRDALGSINRIEDNGEITSLGNLWYDNDKALNRSIVRPLSIGDDIHCIMGYGNVTGSILNPDTFGNMDPIQSDNIQYLVYTRSLQYILKNNVFNGSVYDALLEIATLLNATLSFENNIIHLRSRRNLKAKLDGAIGTLGTANIAFKDENKTFPNRGYLRIDNEIIEYTGMSGSAFTNIQRGLLSTEIVEHSNETECAFLNDIIDFEDILKDSLLIKGDTRRIFNITQDSARTLTLPDASSLAKYPENTLTLNLSRMTDHERQWKKILLNEYLQTFKELQKEITFRIKPKEFLRVGNTLGFQGPMGLYTIQILSLKKTERAIEVGGRTFPIISTTPIPAIPPAYTSFTAQAGNAQIVLNWALPDAFPALTDQEIRYATSQTALASASWNSIGGSDKATRTSHTLTGLANNVTIYAQIRGVNSEGNGVASAIINATPMLIPAIPPQYTTFSATGGNTQLTLNWVLPNAHPALTDQEIRYATSQAALSSASWNSIGGSDKATRTSHTLTGLTNDVEVYAQIRGVNSEGNGAVSAIVSATPERTPAVPPAYTTFTAQVGNTQLTLNWALPNAYPALTDQEIRYATSEAALSSATWNSIGGSDRATRTSHTITGLTNNVTIYTQIRGVNSQGNGIASAVVSATPITRQGAAAPASLSAFDTLDFLSNRKWAAFRWEQPSELGTGTFVRYEYLTYHNENWVSVGSATQTNTFDFNSRDDTPYQFSVRIITQDSEGELIGATATLSNAANAANTPWT